MDAETESLHESEFSIHLIRQIITAEEEKPAWERGSSTPGCSCTGGAIGKLEDRLQLSDYAVITKKEEMDVLKLLKRRGKFDGRVYTVCDTASQRNVIHKSGNEVGIKVTSYYDQLNPQLNRQQ